jgi:hypothetical protein
LVQGGGVGAQDLAELLGGVISFDGRPDRQKRVGGGVGERCIQVRANAGLGSEGFPG